MSSVTVSLEEMIEMLPRYGQGRSGQIYVKFDDVIRQLRMFYRLLEETQSSRDSDTAK